ncbi:hypothetical protein D0Z07_7185 [Hyphodiscus hymeniophilus]|uniref:Uncharacterized protein n=1 Tax=Hyphodiscus hymeniophilus TaxID=353542 RepID=A0A9P6VGK4_9HELO|nr:hypothetical protein D0Z07_7185 [Hyphodiscus hymeniophilus]
MEFPAGYFEEAWDEYYVEFEAMIGHAAEVCPNANFFSQYWHNLAVIRHSYEMPSSFASQESYRTPYLDASILTGRVAERLVDLEEEGLEIESAEDVPNWARVSGVDIRFDSDGRRAYLQYMRQRTKDGKRDVIAECLQW